MRDKKDEHFLKKVISSRALLVLLALVLIFGFVALIREIQRHSNLEEEFAGGQSQIQNLEIQNQKLIARLNQLKSDAFREKTVREKLGLQAPGEKVIIITRDEAEELVPEKKDFLNLFQKNKTTQFSEQSMFSNLKNWWRYFTN